MQTEERHGFDGDGYVYLRNPLWWAGIATRQYLPRIAANQTASNLALQLVSEKFATLPPMPLRPPFS